VTLACGLRGLLRRRSLSSRPLPQIPEPVSPLTRLLARRHLLSVAFCHRAHILHRLFFVVDPKYGEISRAMRNRGIEIALLSPAEFALPLPPAIPREPRAAARPADTTLTPAAGVSAQAVMTAVPWAMSPNLTSSRDWAKLTGAVEVGDTAPSHTAACTAAAAGPEATVEELLAGHLVEGLTESTDAAGGARGSCDTVGDGFRMSFGSFFFTFGCLSVPTPRNGLWEVSRTKGEDTSFHYPGLSGSLHCLSFLHSAGSARAPAALVAAVTGQASPGDLVTLRALHWGAPSNTLRAALASLIGTRSGAQRDCMIQDGGMRWRGGEGRRRRDGSREGSSSLRSLGV